MDKNCGNCYNFIFEKRYSHLICGGFCSEKHSEIRCACSPDTQCEKWVYSGAKTCKCRRCAFFILGCPLEPVDCNCFEPRIDGQFYTPSDNVKANRGNYFNGKACHAFICDFFLYHQDCTPIENFLIGNILKSL